MAWFRRNAIGVADAVTVLERNEPHYGPNTNLSSVGGFLGLGGTNDAGVVVNENTAMGSTAFFRSVSVIASTIATLPLKTYSTAGDDSRREVSSIFDDPCPQFFTQFEWVELCMVHAIMWGNVYLLHLYSNAGALVGLFPIHPAMITPEWICDANGNIVGKRYAATVSGTVRYLDTTQMTQIMGLGTDGLAGMSVLSVARNAIGTTLAGDKAAARMFSSGMLVGGLVTADETLSKEDAEIVMSGLKAKLTGAQNAGDIALVNASLKFTPWSMTADDAQFIESRQYQVEEISRLLGVPKVLLAEDGASSWGTGIGQLLAWMSRTTFMAWTSRFEQRLSLLLSNPRHVEFVYAGLLQGTPAEEVALQVQLIDAGIMTVDEVRAIRNLPPLSAPEVTPPLGAEPPPAATTPGA